MVELIVLGQDIGGVLCPDGHLVFQGPVLEGSVGFSPISTATVESLNAVSTIPYFAAALLGFTGLTALSVAVGLLPWSCVAETLVDFWTKSFHNFNLGEFAGYLLIYSHDGSLQLPIGGVGDKEDSLRFVSIVSCLFSSRFGVGIWFWVFLVFGF